MNSLSNKITICHILNLITGRADGVYTHLKMLLNLLPKDKYRQIVIFQGGTFVENDLRQMGIGYHIVPWLGKRSFFSASYSVIRILKTENVDIIQSHLVKPYILSGVINLFLRKRHIFNYNGLFIDNLYYNKLEKLLLNILHYLITTFKAVNIAVVPSLCSKTLLINETNRFPKVDVYYNGYDPSFPESSDPAIINYIQNLKSDYFIVGIIARLEIQKRIDHALDICKALLNRNQNVFFIFMGDGPLENSSKEYANKLGISSNISFLGYVNNARNYIKYLDTLLFTSDWEGLPLTIWEAMYNKVPIISTDVGGNKEIIDGEKCGFVFARGDIYSAVNYIQKLISDPALKNKLGENGIDALNRKYSYNNFRLFFENLYDKLCPQKNN